MAHDVIVLSLVRHRDPPLAQRVQDDLTNVVFFHAATGTQQKKVAGAFCRKTYAEHVERFLEEVHRALHRCKEFGDRSLAGCKQSVCEVLGHHRVLRDFLREEGDEEACRRVARALEAMDKIAEWMAFLSRG